MSGYFSRICMISFVTLVLFSCSNAQDQEKNSFPTVRIGAQEWMAENLNTSTFRNGDPIPEVKDAEAWRLAAESHQPAWCYYENDPANESYGKLYNFYAVEDPRGLAPEGWHVSAESEWATLVETLVTNNTLATRMKNNTGWAGDGSGTNESGFSAIPAGGRGVVTGFRGLGNVAVFWSSTSVGDLMANYRVIHGGRTTTYLEEDYKGSGFSVRCVQNE